MKSKRVQALVLAAAVAGGIRGRGGVLGLGAAVGRGRHGLRSGRRPDPLRAHRVLRRRRRPAARPDRHGRRRQRPAAQRRPRPGRHRRAWPRRTSRCCRGSPTPSSRRPCRCSAPSPTRTSRSTATTWTTPGPTPTTTPAVADADVDAPEGWDGGTGNGRIVAVVDTGYDSDHPELAGALWTNPAESCGSADTDGNGKAGDCHGWNFTTNSADVDNGADGAHGTSVAGVIGGRAGNGLGTAGVAPDVTIMPLVIGSGSVGRRDPGRRGDPLRRRPRRRRHQRLLGRRRQPARPWTTCESAIAYAAAHDVLVVAAAGNDAANRDTSPLYPASLTDANVVTVGNSTAADRSAPSSAYGAAIGGPLRAGRPGVHDLERRRLPAGLAAPRSPRRRSRPPTPSTGPPGRTRRRPSSSRPCSTTSTRCRPSPASR